MKKRLSIKAVENECTKAMQESTYFKIARIDSKNYYVDLDETRIDFRSLQEILEVYTGMSSIPVVKKVITRRHRIGTIENLLNIRTELVLRDYENSGESQFKIWRFINNCYMYCDVCSKDELIEECNQ